MSEIGLLIEKYNTGDYICVLTLSNSNDIIHNPYFDLDYTEYKLIHKKHENVLMAFLDGKEIEWTNSKEYLIVENFIDTYVEDRYYRIKETKSSCEVQNSNLDGSKNSFYAIPEWVEDLDDLSEYLELDPYEFNILKTLWIHKGNRHSGNSEKRELNKRVHYANKSLKKFERLENER